MPLTFEKLTTRDHAWSLDAFVDEVNRVLPEVVPQDAAKRAKVEVNARLVRHYTTEGALPKPLKDGAEARYDTDHLVRMLALRRLLLEGYPSGVAAALLRKHDRETLARFLLGELRLELDLATGGLPANPTPLDHVPPHVRERLSAMRANAGLPPLAAAGEAPEPSPAGSRGDTDTAAPRVHVTAQRLAGRESRPPTARPTAPGADEAVDTSPPAVTWTRHQLLPSLELHVREDFDHPTTPAGWNALRDAVLARLEAIALTRPKDH